MDPYLEGDPRDMFDAWHEEMRRRFEESLTFAEIRKGVQALASLYTRRRGRLGGTDPVFGGAGKRAAFALYYAPLHFLATWHVVRDIGFDRIPFRRLWDLGCGTGAGGAAWGAAMMEADVEADPSPVIGLDRSPFAVEVAAASYDAFGLKGSARRIDLSDLLLARGARSRRKGRPGRGAGPSIHDDDAVLLAWTLNELEEGAREKLIRDLASSGGRPVLILEPVAKGVAPWWSRCTSVLGESALAVHAFQWRRRLELPEWIASMDRAAGLDHGELTARVLGVLG
jgi:hypothetical protein